MCVSCLLCCLSCHQLLLLHEQPLLHNKRCCVAIRHCRLSVRPSGPSDLSRYRNLDWIDNTSTKLFS